MNKRSVVDEMIKVVEEIERNNHREKFDSEKSYKTNTINRILEELDKVVENENK